MHAQYEYICIQFDAIYLHFYLRSYNNLRNISNHRNGINFSNSVCLYTAELQLSLYDLLLPVLQSQQFGNARSNNAEFLALSILSKYRTLSF